MSKITRLTAIIGVSAGVFIFASCSQRAGEPAANAPQTEAVAVDSPEPVRVTVSKNGFEPKTINVKKGRPVKLAVTRTDEENCGGEILFPKQEIRKPLPLNETVLIELTADEAGEIGFTCGMDMLRGKIVVQ